MKKYGNIIPILIIAVSLVGCGIIQSSAVDRSDDSTAYLTNVLSSYDDGYGEMKSFETALSRFSNIDINLSVGDVTVEKGTDYSIEYCFPEKIQPEYGVKDGTLVIEGKEVKTISDNKLSKTYLIITVPEEMDLKDVSISVAMSDVNVDDIHADKLKGKTSMGDVYVKRCEFSDAKWDCAMGYVSFDGKYNKLNLESSMGDIKVSNNTNWKGTLKTGMGNIEVDGKPQGALYTK
ncbi:hypothetical protein D6855_04965 [Butyrivibrio sp. CB08]|uniref:DUF4097 family beta strand repeat-containing protein n=1 Tax=Butyrivibrio sp. CB08 TaxID=2364879 RepID=UPI000EA94D9D|nr:DUF4097 family beta strand repeat-containing protein [Butyrivibrio sp. CB08]RKM61244.1 hypothetical protein D6855_04965 [Butyrivibrio sp. CB08]